MILRRFIAHLNEQNWFAVGLDLLVVVVGIFLGMQVTEWNEDRKEAITAQKYLHRIEQDLYLDRKSLIETRAFWEQVKSNSETAIVFADTGDRQGKTSWQLLLAFFQASQVDPFQSSNITYDEMKSTGQLSLFQNSNLRRDLAVYYSFTSGLLAKTLLQTIPEYRDHVRGLFPTHVTRYIWQQCHKAELGNQLLIDCESPIDQAEAEELLQEILAEKNLLRELRTWNSTLVSRTPLLTRILGWLDRTIALVELEQGK